jgi:hypothetical protein
MTNTDTPGNIILPAYSATFVMFMKYYIIIAVICGIGYIIYLGLKKYGILKDTEPNKTTNNTANKTDNVLEQTDNAAQDNLANDKTANNKNEIYYLYWTGGYDSTFRLCEMLLNERKIVQPLYVSLALDNDCQTEESCTKVWVRRNRKEEKQAMLRIRRELARLYPKASRRLLPTIYIDTDIDDASFNKAFDAKFYEDNLWPGKRKKHQYLFLSKFAYYHKLPIDIGVLGIHEKSKFAKFLTENLVAYNSGPIEMASKNYKIKQPVHFMMYLRFPLFGRTKTDLLAKAKKHGYDNILKYTWSCWFPNRNGTPCGKCPMCKERIV